MSTSGRPRLILAGVFTTDPGAGFPPGAPLGAPGQVSWHGVLHEVGFAVSALAWIAFCVVLARRFAALRERGWVAACVATPVAVIVVDALPDMDSLSLRLVIGTAIQYVFLVALAIRLLREVRAPRHAAQPG
ncbi:DUF998 domain-containing protein [Nonomuraea insulae]|uniref:DUF998 domain-containing protein n=1 Tax=Nonomuraea insulae TaxID=1616787 RepID=A0ABW1CWV7_9ACTN